MVHWVTRIARGQKIKTKKIHEFDYVYKTIMKNGDETENNKSKMKISTTKKSNMRHLKIMIKIEIVKVVKSILLPFMQHPSSPPSHLHPAPLGSSILIFLVWFTVGIFFLI